MLFWSFCHYSYDFSPMFVLISPGFLICAVIMILDFGVRQTLVQTLALHLPLSKLDSNPKPHGPHLQMVTMAPTL